jgi:transcriptional regulator with XRE-family HTH domain
MPDDTRTTASQPMKAIEKFLEHIRELGISQAEAARQFGFSDSFLCEILAGRKVPSLRRAFQIEDWSHGKVPAKEWLC